jgi:hypothetical protein
MVRAVGPSLRIPGQARRHCQGRPGRPTFQVGPFAVGDVGAIEVDGVLVVAREGAFRVRLRGAVVVPAVVVVPVLVVPLTVAASEEVAQVDVRTRVLSGPCAPRVGAAERCRLSQQHARQQEHGHKASEHDTLFDRKTPSNITNPPEDGQSDPHLRTSGRVNGARRATATPARSVSDGLREPEA